MQKPEVKPNHPFFSSGPCSKRPGWNLDALNNAFLGRSHRAKDGKAKLNERKILTKFQKSNRSRLCLTFCDHRNLILS